MGASRAEPGAARASGSAADTSSITPSTSRCARAATASPRPAGPAPGPWALARALRAAGAAQVDDGTEGQFGKEIELRGQLEACACR